MRSVFFGVSCLLCSLVDIAIAAPPAAGPVAGRVSLFGVDDRVARVAIVVNADLETAREAALWDEVQKTVEALGPDQSFNILSVFFEAYAAVDRDELLPATAANRRRAYGFIEDRIRRRPGTGVARALSASVLREAAERTRPGVRRGLLAAAAEKLDRPKRFEMNALPRPLHEPARRFRERFLKGLDLGGHRPDFAVERAIAMGSQVIYLFDDCTGDAGRMAGLELYEACSRLNTERKVRFHVIALVREEDLKEALPAEVVANIEEQLNEGTFTLVARDARGELRRMVAGHERK